MIKAIIKTGIFVVCILVLAQFVPFVAEHEQGLLVAAVAFGLIGIIGKLFIWLLLAVAVVFLFHPFL